MSHFRFIVWIIIITLFTFYFQQIDELEAKLKLEGTARLEVKEWLKCYMFEYSENMEVTKDCFIIRI